MGAIYYKGQKYGAMPASAANLPYEAGSQDSTKDKIDGLNAGNLPIGPNDSTSIKNYIDNGLANVGDKLIFRQTQLNLPSAVNVTAGGVFTLLGGVSLNSLTWNALDGIDDLSNKTLVGAHLIWANSSSCIPVNEIVESGNKFSLGVYAVASATVSAVRLLTWWK